MWHWTNIEFIISVLRYMDVRAVIELEPWEKPFSCDSGDAKGTSKCGKSRGKHSVLFSSHSLFSIVLRPRPKAINFMVTTVTAVRVILQDPKLRGCGSCFYVMKLYFQEGRADPHGFLFATLCSVTWPWAWHNCASEQFLAGGISGKKRITGYKWSEWQHNCRKLMMHKAVDGLLSSLQSIPSWT